MKRDTEEKKEIRKVQQAFSKFLLDNVYIEGHTNNQVDIMLSEIARTCLDEKLRWEYNILNMEEEG